jgi:hypothetical protein
MALPAASPHQNNFSIDDKKEKPLLFFRVTAFPFF